MVERARIRDNARDVRADVPQVRHEKPIAAIPEHFIRLGLHVRGAAGGQRERDLHPPPDVDKRVREAELLHEIADREFLWVVMVLWVKPHWRFRRRRTHLVVEGADALCAGRRPVAWDDALHADFFRGAKDILLDIRAGRADQDIDARECFPELLRGVFDVSQPNLDAGRTEGLRLRLGYGCRTNERSDALFRESAISDFMRRMRWDTHESSRLEEPFNDALPGESGRAEDENERLSTLR